MQIKVRYCGPRRTIGEVVVVKKVEFEVRVGVVPDAPGDTVPDMDPASSVSVEIINEVMTVVSVTRVVSVEIQVVLTVTDSVVTDAEVW